MAWAKPEYSRGRIDSAGAIISNQDLATIDFINFQDALGVVNNWRSSHSRPLQALKMTLRDRARRTDDTALVAQRIKRIPAILVKLNANPNMKLSKMHDIGGCRAVLRNVSLAEQLVKVYEEATAKNPKRAGEFVHKYDYISAPKSDGYRSVHLVYKYQSEASDLKPYVGLRIEIQIRSQMQHLWATAVETVDFFTKQAIKSHMGDISWIRFFSLMSSAIARIENRPLVPNTPTTPEALREELSKLTEQIQIINGIRRATEEIEQSKGDIYLLSLDSKEGAIRVISFVKDAIGEAEQMYLEEEKTIKDNPNKQVVLVSVDSLASLKKAYPNYFMDIGGFVHIMRRVLTRGR